MKLSIGAVGFYIYFFAKSSGPACCSQCFPFASSVEAVSNSLMMFFCRAVGQAGPAWGEDGDRQCLTNRAIKFSGETWTTAPRRHSLPRGRCGVVLRDSKQSALNSEWQNVLVPLKTPKFPNQPWWFFLSTLHFGIFKKIFQLLPLI